MTKMKLTVDEYNALEGNTCPFCEFHGDYPNSVYAEPVEVDQQIIYRDNHCPKCGEAWTEYFTVTEIERIP